jgi:hypothetical protein
MANRKINKRARVRQQLRAVRIVNLKSIRDELFPLADFTPLVGYNNAGKSNILLGIHWLLEPWPLERKVFNDSTRGVEVYGSFSGLSKRLLAQLPEEEALTLGAFVQHGEVHVCRRQSTPSQPLQHIELLIRIPGSEAGEYEWLAMPEEAVRGLYRLFPKPIFISGFDHGDSYDKELSIVGRLIGEIVKPLEERYSAQIEQSLKGLRKLVHADGWQRAEELAEFDERANANLAPLFPNIDLKVHIPIPSVGDIFRSGTLRVYDDENRPPQSIDQVGEGTRRTIQMALLRQLAEVMEKRAHRKSRRLLLIDSPELYLHPQAVELVRVSLKNLADEAYQIVFATHSAQMVTSEDVGTSLLIRKVGRRGTCKRQRIEDAVKQVIRDAPSQLQMLFSLSNSNELLFAENVLLTEGKTERRLLPRIFETLVGESFALIKCALIRQGGVSNTRKSMQVLHAMDLPTKAIVDLDYAFTSAPAHNYLSKKDKDLQYLLELMDEIAEEKGIRLQNGLPVNRNSSMSAAAAYAVLAAMPEAQEAIVSLHEKLLKKDIWLWTRGAIEDHLGLTAKNENAWATFLKDLQQKNPEDVIRDYDSVMQLCQWIRSSKF